MKMMEVQIILFIIGCDQKILYDLERKTLSTEFKLYCEDKSKRDLLISIMFSGTIFGCIIQSFIGDTFGRKKAMLYGN